MARKPSRYEAAYWTDGVPAGFKNKHGWLVDDGNVDKTAIHLVVTGHRVPDLTYREALMAVTELIEQAETRNISARELVSARFGVTLERAKSMMSAARTEQGKRTNGY